MSMVNMINAINLFGEDVMKEKIIYQGLLSRNTPTVTDDMLKKTGIKNPIMAKQFTIMLASLCSADSKDVKLQHAAELAAIVDNESGFRAFREYAKNSYPNADSIIKWCRVNGYDGKNLGNQPWSQPPQVDDDPAKYRGAFLNQLTGRANFKAVFTSISGLTDTLKLPAKTQSLIKELAKGGDKVTAGDIDDLSSNGFVNLAVLIVYYYRRAIDKDVPKDLKIALNKILASKESAISFIKHNGYGDKRITLKNGAIVPSAADIKKRSDALKASLSNVYSQAVKLTTVGGKNNALSEMGLTKAVPTATQGIKVNIKFNRPSQLFKRKRP